MAKKCSVPKPLRLRNLQLFFFHVFVTILKTVTNFDKEVFRKESFHGTNCHCQNQIIMCPYFISTIKQCFLLSVVLFLEKC